MDAKKTGELIAALRKEKGWSQTEIAERLGVTNKAVSRWETGRGYPDVELLPMLARELGITISELLEGSRTPTPPQVDEQMEFLCESTGREKKKRWAVMVTAAVVLMILLVIRVYPRLVGFADYVIGSRECVIARDYSGLTYNGERYTVFPTGEYGCRDLGVVLVSEAQVEGAGFLKKLLYGETLYALAGDYFEHDIVYLQTEYDDLLSPYFVRESMYREYAEKLEDGVFEDYCGVIWQEDGGCGIFPLGQWCYPLLMEAEQGAPLEVGSFGRGELRLDVRVYDEEKLFYRECGELVRVGETWYWSPRQWSEQTGTVTTGVVYYQVEGELFPES